MLNGSIGLLLRYLAEKNRIKEAEAFPNPCLDVVASYKILTALVIFPVAGLLYYLFFYLIMRFYVFPNDPARYNNFTIYFIILWPIYTFCNTSLSTALSPSFAFSAHPPSTSHIATRREHCLTHQHMPDATKRLPPSNL